MKTILQILSSILLIIIFSCKSPQNMTQTSDKTNHWPDGVTYEIFVQSFADSNGDGIGDLNGVTAKLDYLIELGVDAIWLMPIHPSPSYHKYDVVDYKGIHPDYGTMDDFKRLLDEAHQREIKVILDLVINHTSHKHPWFIESKKGPENPYREYYTWRNYEDIKDEISKKAITLDSDNITQWHENGDNKKDEERYYGFFWWEMPDLNFDSKKVRKEVYEIGEFWLKEVGIDGFRLDAAAHIYPDDRKEDTHAFWEEFLEEMQKIKPDVYLVGEVWGQPKTLAPYLKGLPALFNFSMSEAIIASLNETEEKNIIDSVLLTQAAYQAVNPNYTNATILSNHDQNRIMSTLEGDIPKAKLAATLLFVLPGSPYLYYGEELGMLGAKPDEQIREPFIWDKKDKDPMQTTWEDLTYNTAENIDPLTVQRNDPNSLFNHYKNLIQLRKDFPELRGRDIIKINENAFTRTSGSGMIIFFNYYSKELPLDLSFLDIKEKNYSLPPYSAILSYTREGKTHLKLIPQWIDIDPIEDKDLMEKYLGGANKK